MLILGLKGLSILARSKTQASACVCLYITCMKQSSKAHAPYRISNLKLSISYNSESVSFKHHSWFNFYICSKISNQTGQTFAKHHYRLSAIASTKSK